MSKTDLKLLGVMYAVIIVGGALTLHCHKAHADDISINIVVPEDQAEISAGQKQNAKTAFETFQSMAADAVGSSTNYYYRPIYTRWEGKPILGAETDKAYQDKEIASFDSAYFYNSHAAESTKAAQTLTLKCKDNCVKVTLPPKEPKTHIEYVLYHFNFEYGYDGDKTRTVSVDRIGITYDSETTCKAAKQAAHVLGMDLRKRSNDPSALECVKVELQEGER